MSTADLLAPNPKPWCKLNVQSINLAGGGSSLGYYEEYVDTNFRFQGPWNQVEPTTLRVIRIGNQVTLQIKSFTDTAFISTVIVSFSILPARFCPSIGMGSVQGFCRVVDNGTQKDGLFIVDTNGVISMYSSATGGNFAGVGSTGLFGGLGVSYTVL
jgi:hypothetical protein